MIRADRKEQIDKTIARKLKFSEATFPFIPTPQERCYFALEMARLEHRADQKEMLKILGITILSLGVVILVSWMIIKWKG